MVSLAFHALDYDSAATPHVQKGIGDLTEGRTGTIYLPDDSSPVIWQPVTTGVPGKYYAGGKWWSYGGAAGTNDQIQSNDLTDVEWTASNMTVAQDETGLRGDANAACTLTATAENATVLANAITAASDDQTTRWLIKRKTGTGTINITVDGGSTWQDVTTEVDSTAGFNEAIEHLAALANPQIGIRVVTNTDAVIVGNGEAHLGKTQTQVRGSTPIFTSGSTVSVEATDLSFDDGNHVDLEGAYFCEFKNVGVNAANTGGLLGMGGSGRLIYFAGATAVTTRDGTTGTTSGVLANTLLADDREYKIGIAYGSSNKRINVEDNWGPAGAYDGSYNSAGTMKIFASTTFSSAPTMVMLMRNLRRYDMTYAEALIAIPLMMNGIFPSEGLAFSRNLARDLARPLARDLAG